LLYTYDAAGNRIKTGGTFGRSNIPPALTTTMYNANNQQTTFGTATETYDLNGNLATFTDASGTTTYTWNTRNQLTTISGPSLTGSFTYDSFGRRTGKTINGTTTNFVYDGLNPIQEKAGATVTANLLTGLGIDEFFTRTDGVGVRALLPDALGSTIALGDGTGTLQTQYTYEPFGVTTQTGSANTNSYKYTGREDDGSGLIYYRARHYHPRLQRFISEDPIGFRGRQMNLYGYVRNAPTIYIDSYGLEVGQIGPNSNKNSAQFPFTPKDPWPVPPADNSSSQNLDAMRRTPNIGPQCSPTGTTIINVWKTDKDRVGNNDWVLGLQWVF
jgi:RHS repeat-associated protein